MQASALEKNTNELVVITGASRGIGWALAKRFLVRGAGVVNVSRSPCPLPGVTQIRADLSIAGFERGIEAELLALAEGRDRLVVVHNAAMLQNDDVRNVDSEVFARTLAVALVAPAALNRLLMPHMRRGSAILYVGSTLSEKAVSGLLSYVTSKHAVIGLMRSTCQDLLGSGVHTACVCPGVTDTELLRQRVADSEETLRVLRSMTGDGRLIDPDEIAAVLEFAADHPVVNGTVIHANLGQKEH